MPVVAFGRVEPWNRILKVVPTQGRDHARIAELSVKEGEKVSAGQILAIIDTAPQLKTRIGCCPDTRGKGHGSRKQGAGNKGDVP
jgi:hypothetical protein